MIPYAKQDINEDDITAVVRVLKSDWLTQGPSVGDFERAVSCKVGAAYGIATNSATSALHLACIALGLGVGDWLWTSPNTFVASANCGLYCGAQVDFVDIDQETYNISVEKLSDKLEKADKDGTLPKVLVAVHFAGHPCEMETIHKLSKQYGFRVIEDASHAIGASYQGKLVGSCIYSDITIFSFHPVKIMTSGEGGMAVTNNSEFAEHMKRLRSHGVTRESKQMQHCDGPWYYEQMELGFNYRMTDILSALGLSQLARLDEFISERQRLASVYTEALCDLPVFLPYQSEQVISAFHLYPIRLKLGLNRDVLFNRLREAGIGVNVHYIPVHLQPYYQKMGFRSGDFPEAESYYKHAISIPMYVSLSHTAQMVVIDALRKNLCD